MRVRDGMVMRPNYMVDTGGLDVKIGECKVLNGLRYFPIVYDDLSSCIMSEEEIKEKFVKVTV